SQYDYIDYGTSVQVDLYSHNSGAIILAVYDKNTNEMKKVAIGCEKGTITVDTAADDIVKLMQWDGIQTMRPVAEPIVIR
ncbi:MAG: hypothetical protein J6N52_03750, partial [Clostridia bacterium]|nr:hypothetical protein [Clostridia bacterium]